MISYLIKIKEKRSVKRKRKEGEAKQSQKYLTFLGIVFRRKTFSPPFDL